MAEPLGVVAPAAVVVVEADGRPPVGAWGSWEARGVAGAEPAAAAATVVAALAVPGGGTSVPASETSVGTGGTLAGPAGTGVVAVNPSSAVMRRRELAPCRAVRVGVGVPPPMLPPGLCVVRGVCSGLPVALV